MLPLRQAAGNRSEAIAQAPRGKTVIPTTEQLLALRNFVPDCVLLDWADLAQLIQPPASIRTDVLREHWVCSQSAVSRRLAALWQAGLIDYRCGRGAYRVRHLGTR